MSIETDGHDISQPYARELARQVGELETDNAELLTALRAAAGYLTNAAIDLQSGAPKKTALATINGGLRMVQEAIARGERG